MEETVDPALIGGIVGAVINPANPAPTAASPESTSNRQTARRWASRAADNTIPITDAVKARAGAANAQIIPFIVAVLSIIHKAFARVIPVVGTPGIVIDGLGLADFDIFTIVMKYGTLCCFGKYPRESPWTLRRELF